MKKLKIFLMISLIVSFGFALSFEVHASGPKILQENTYLTFQSTGSFTLKTANNQKNWNGTLYYSTDTTTWNVWSGTITLSSVGNKLYLRGTGNTKITGNNTNYRWVLTGSNIECIGNIENLLDYETVALGNHPTMAIYCYADMFNGCTGLTTAPSLPATTLANSCYRSMFLGCTGLTTAPSLPATTLTNYCYAGMFDGCTGLTTAPSLPATTLAKNCYYYMFRNCTSLTTAPSLPATTLVDYCYFGMFQGCTSLKISSDRIGDYQYEWRIPTSGTGTTATGWNKDMLLNTGGPFTSDPSIDTTYYVENPPVSGSGFNITFEENGGTTIPDIDEATELPTPLPIPIKSGYTFVGWYYDIAFTQIANAGDTLESNVTLYAKWGRTFTPKNFEVGDVLSPGQIKISWDFSEITLSEDDFIRIEGTNDFAIYLAVHRGTPFYAEMSIMGYYTDIIKGNTMINLDNISVITEIKSDGNSDFWPIIDALSWEFIGDYQDGYDVGYTSAREYYGFYDFSSNEWLSVTEYIDRYGTDKMNQTDFYNNFDKYFIPAMIIVFGGAIVLTILKVFKGRE